MLKHLHIQNYALISHLDIDFGQGFSVLTGETGAGKSIILGALALVLGARADSKSITDGEDKCIIEAEFDEGLIRRELYRNGKSRSFVDDGLVTLQELKQLANRLIDIHSQHANLLIENQEFQLEVVDAIAANSGLLTDYQAQYEHYQAQAKEYERMRQQAKKNAEDADYILYRFKTLDEANLEAEEMNQLEEEQYRLSHAEEIRTALETAVAALNGEQYSATETLRACRLNEAAPELQERIDSARIELQDIAQEAERAAMRMEMDPNRLQWVEERIATLHDLMRKFGVASIEELIALRDELGQQVTQLDRSDFDLEQMRAALAQELHILTQKAQALTKSRQAVVPQICEQLTEGLKQLGVAHAKVEILIEPAEEFSTYGKDDVQIRFAANLNQSLRNVSEVASGGEISRLMLCVKALIASTKGLPTIIFDEIDTGVSGTIATQMATIMRRMAAHRQIIAITHLPQIAALGETHYKVYKADTDTRTETHISRLDEQERIIEIASMLSGSNVTEAAINTAKELVNAKMNK